MNPRSRPRSPRPRPPTTSSWGRARPAPRWRPGSPRTRPSRCCCSKPAAPTPLSPCTFPRRSPSCSAVSTTGTTTPSRSPHSRTAPIYWPRGKTLGGSSSLNAMMWIRGFAADYDDWADAAGERWSWRSLVPYFRRVERTAGSGRPDAGHGRGSVRRASARSPPAHGGVPRGGRRGGSRRDRAEPPRGAGLLADDGVAAPRRARLDRGRVPATCQGAAATSACSPARSCGG